MSTSDGSDEEEERSVARVYFFEARAEEEEGDGVHEYVHEVGVQEGCSDEAVDLSLLHEGTKRTPHVDEHLLRYLQHFLILLLHSLRQTHSVHHPHRQQKDSH